MTGSGPPSDPRAGTFMGRGREFDRIRGFLAGLPDPGPRVLVGPGDDAAVLDDGLVVSTDLSVEGVHFRLDWISAEEAGYRAAMGGLSDIAAMGGDPVGILASVAAPEGARGAGVGGGMMAGIRAAAKELGAPLLGGDLTRSPGPLLVDVVVLGRAEHPMLRSRARPGDELWVTGVLGGAAGAVAAWEAGGEPAPSLRAAFVRPVARISEAGWLAGEGARAGLDLSDGLAGDAGHLAAASGVSVLLEADRVPVHPDLGAGTLPPDADPLELALHGGDDYEILVAVPTGTLEPRVEEFTRLFDLSLTRVGRVGEGSGVELAPRGGGSPRALARGGFDHFSEGEGQ